MVSTPAWLCQVAFFHSVLWQRERGKLRLKEKCLHLTVCYSSGEPVGHVLTPSAHPRSHKLPHNQTTQSRRRGDSRIFPLAWRSKFDIISPSDRCWMRWRDIHLFQNPIRDFSTRPCCGKLATRIPGVPASHHMPQSMLDKVA